MAPDSVSQVVAQIDEWYDRLPTVSRRKSESTGSDTTPRSRVRAAVSSSGLSEGSMPAIAEPTTLHYVKIPIVLFRLRTEPYRTPTP